MIGAFSPSAGRAQASPEASVGVGPHELIDAVLAPRSPDGRLRVLASEATQPVEVDGALDEEVWLRAEPVDGFVQSEPQEGQPATEPTEVRVAFDSNHLYISAYCHDSGALVVNNIRKDFGQGDQDSFEVILDTFADRRNGYVFMTNPEGARSDRQVANEGRETNASWDAVWHTRTRQTSDGWTLEMAIPFRALRFDPARPVWGINFSRHIRRKNEIDFWSPVPRAYELSRVSVAGNLEGLPAGSLGRDLRLKPYAVAKTLRSPGGAGFTEDASAGLDLKYGVTPGLTLDLSGNPDFAQVEADELQVNLTQFSTFYPEKRDFFLENSGIFYVGDAARNNRITTSPTPDEDLLLFHSRRMGLAADGTPIPITVGARLTGKAAGLALGALTVQTRRLDETGPSNYTVLRARRNVFATSDIGGIFMTRQSTANAADYNRVYGVDGNIRFFGNIDWNSYFIKTVTPGKEGGQYAVRTTLNRESNFFHVKGGVMSLGDNFNDDLGYYRRVGVVKYLLDTGVRPRSAALRRKGLREIHPHVVWNYFTDHDGHMVGKRLHNGLSFFFNNGGFAELSANPEFQLITRPFRIHPGSAPIPPGGYGWNEWQLRVSTDPSRALTGGFTGIVGGLWSGTQRTVNLSLTVRPSYRFRATLGLSRTAAKLDLPRIDFVTGLWTLRVNYSFTTNMFLDSLLQYDQDQRQLNANLRFNIIHRPLSDFFIVYNEQRFTSPESPLPGRALIVKFTQMFAF